MRHHLISEINKSNTVQDRHMMFREGRVCVEQNKIFPVEHS